MSLVTSLDKARTLKEAGLEWEPKRGDFCVTEWGDILLIAHDKDEYVNHCLWLPRLDQLLAEIEKRGYGWKLSASTYPKVYLSYKYRLELTAYIRTNGRDHITQESFWANSPENAAAEALLWIL